MLVSGWREAPTRLSMRLKKIFVPQGVLRQWDELGFGRPAGAPARLQEVGGPKGPSPEPSLGRARARTRAGPVRAGTPLFKLPGKTTKYPPLDGYFRLLPWDRSSLKGVGIGVARSANAALNAAIPIRPTHFCGPGAPKANAHARWGEGVRRRVRESREESPGCGRVAGWDDPAMPGSCDNNKM